MKWSVKKLVTTAMLAAVAGVLMSLEFSVPLMPVFYKVDFSDVPAVIALFTMGPVSGLSVEIVKILIKLITVGTNSNYVGEFSNLIGAFMFILPIWFVSRKMPSNKKGMAASLAISGVIRIAWACFCNACITLPMYAATMGISIDALTAQFTPALPAVQNLSSFIILATIPFNFIKLSLNYGIAVILFDRLTAAVPSLRGAPLQKRAGSSWRPARGSSSPRFSRYATGNKNVPPNIRVKKRDLLVFIDQEVFHFYLQNPGESQKVINCRQAFAMLPFVNGLRVLEPEVVLKLPHAQAGFPAAAFDVATSAFKVYDRERNSFCHDLLLNVTTLSAGTSVKNIIRLFSRKSLNFRFNFTNAFRLCLPIHRFDPPIADRGIRSLSPHVHSVLFAVI